MNKTEIYHICVGKRHKLTHWKLLTQDKGKEVQWREGTK
jgi:hypothetical protein